MEVSKGRSDREAAQMFFFKIKHKNLLQNQIKKRNKNVFKILEPLLNPHHQ